MIRRQKNLTPCSSDNGSSTSGDLGNVAPERELGRVVVAPPEPGAVDELLGLHDGAAHRIPGLRLEIEVGLSLRAGHDGAAHGVTRFRHFGSCWKVVERTFAFGLSVFGIKVDFALASELLT